MKKLLLFVFMIPTLVHSQIINKQLFPLDKEGNIVFSEVVNINLQKENLYKNAQDWIAKTFGDYKSVIQFEDKENGKLILKGKSDMKYIARYSISEYKEQLNYTITIECKDNKYRYKIQDLIIDETYKIGNRIGKTTPFSPIKHIEIYERDSIKLIELNANLENFERIIKTEKNKNIRKNYELFIDKLLTDIELHKGSLNQSINFYNEEYEVILLIISSLKSAMTTNDDF